MANVAKEAMDDLQASLYDEAATSESPRLDVTDMHEKFSREQW